MEKMTVFSTVTATLSPELASCMKAKGRTWKDAFFDSLKTLVGVEYAVYRKESQWQIKGEWSAVKRAHHILTKVAIIEKDAMAAYQAELSENNTRTTRLPSPAPDRPQSGTSRRRGRSSRNKPRSLPMAVTTDTVSASMPKLAKRKRGRPRKVRSGDAKEESEAEDNEGTTWTKSDSERGLPPGKNEDTPNASSMAKESVDISSSESYINSQNPGKLPQSRNSLNEEGIFQTHSLATYTSEVVPRTSNSAHEKLKQPSDEKDQDNSQSALPPLLNSDAMGCLSDVQTKFGNVEINDHGRQVETIRLDNSQQDLQDLTSVPKPDVPDNFSDVAIAVAKEAIVCSSANGSSNTKQPPVSSIIQPTRQGSTDVLQADNVETSNIFDYLGIKQKVTIDEFVDDSERFSSEQSKKLEDLIEKMIEKMDRTLTENPKPKVQTGLRYICTECPYTSGKKSELRNHMRQSHMDIDDLIAEAEASHSQAPAAAPPPEVKINERRRLVPRKLHRCIECNYNTNSRKHLKEHKLRKHREKTLQCEICDKKFAVARDLSRHMKDHEGGINPFTCEICGKKYKQHYVLKRHQETHKDGYVKPVYPCNRCSKTFAAKQVLQIHQNSVHLGKKMSYSCPSCGKDFTTKHSLAEHQLIHTNTKPYKCAICNKDFRHESTLKTHERLHTDTTQQFTCEYCGKAFRLRSSLRIHRNIHTGDKRFECPVCKKIFTQKQSLLRHARIHTGEKPFQCHICGSAFYDYSILRRHVTGVHKMQWKSPTQHYVLPPDSYKDGKIIDSNQEPVTQSLANNVPQPPPPPTSQVITSQPGDTVPATLVAQSHLTPQGQVYQPPPVSHTPQAMPPPTHTVTTQRAELPTHTLTTHHLPQSTKHLDHSQQSAHLETNAKMSSIVESQDLAQYQSALLNHNVYQPTHIPLPNTLPNSLTLSQPSPIGCSTPTPQQQQPTPQPTPPLHGPSSNSLSSLAPMTLAQFQQPGASQQSTPSPLTLQSAYSMNQHLYYQSHP